MLTNIRPILPVHWLANTLRWLFLVSTLMVIALDPNRDAQLRLGYVALVLLVAADVVANLVLILLQGLQVWPRTLPAVALFIDMLIAAGFYALYAGPATPLLFVGLLPVAIAALRYGRSASLLAIAGATGSYLLLGLLSGPLDGTRLLVLIGNGVLLLLGATALDHVAALVRLHGNRARQQSENEDQQRIGQTRERARAIYEMASTLSATLQSDKVLESALEVCELGVSDLRPGRAAMVGMVLLFHDDEFELVAARHLTRTDGQVAFRGEGELLRQARQSAEPVLASDAQADSELRQLVALQDCRSIALLPLRAGFENYGLVVFGSPLEHAFGEEELELFSAVANQATIALQNARLYRSLLTEKERIIEVDEDARKKLARDLHDGPTQNVAAIAMRTNFALRLLDREPQRAGEELRKIEELARQTTREMRHMLFTLRPLVLESQGLTAALQQLAEKLREGYGLNVIVEATAFEHRVDATKQGVTFYIVEEALGNVRKHAHARHIWVRLGLRADLFIVQIEDDGVGFDLAKVQSSYDSRGSLGMVNIRERTALINGKLHIESEPGKGTRITVVVPLTQAAREWLDAAEASGKSAARSAAADEALVVQGEPGPGGPAGGALAPEPPRFR